MSKDDMAHKTKTQHLFYCFFLVLSVVAKNFKFRMTSCVLMGSADLSLPTAPPAHPSPPPSSPPSIMFQKFKFLPLGILNGQNSSLFISVYPKLTNPRSEEREDRMQGTLAMSASEWLFYASLQKPDLAFLLL